MINGNWSSRRTHTHTKTRTHTHTLNATSMFALVYVFDPVPMLRFFPKCFFEDPLSHTTFSSSSKSEQIWYNMKKSNKIMQKS